MTKIVSNNPVPLPKINTDQNLAAAAAKKNPTSTKVKVVAGVILSALAFAGLYMTYYMMNQVSKSGAVIPRVVPTYSDKYLLAAVETAQSSDDSSSWDHAAEEYRRFHNYTGAHECFTKCANKRSDEMAARSCQTALKLLENEKQTFAESLDEALAIIKQDLGTASPLLIKIVAEAEKSKAIDLSKASPAEQRKAVSSWSSAAQECAMEDKFEQAKYWCKLCEEKGNSLISKDNSVMSDHEYGIKSSIVTCQMLIRNIPFLMKKNTMRMMS